MQTAALWLTEKHAFETMVLQRTFVTRIETATVSADDFQVVIT